MKKILILDLWYNVKGGANKNALYKEIQKFFEIQIISVEVPAFYKFRSYFSNINFNFSIWKEKKNRYEETVQKRPFHFKMLTEQFSKKIKNIDFDAILQIGSLFGPVHVPSNIPYFSYSDSTVRNPHLLWKKWMPEDFEEFSDEWYSLEKKFFQRMNHIFFYSDYAKNTLIEFYKIHHDNISVVGSSLKIPDVINIPWKNKNDDVIFVSTDFKRKGGFSLVPIFDNVSKVHPTSNLIVVGNIPECFKKVNRSYLKLCGALNRVELIDIYQKASILLHPAIYDPFPSVILEAANFGNPSIASKICGIPEMIKDNETGFIVEPNSAEAFSDKIIYLLKNKKLRRQFGESAQSDVNNRFHPTIVSSKIAKTIKRHL
jgi:glycosyltransferase involved in cell wall biosynthesis